MAGKESHSHIQIISANSLSSANHLRIRKIVRISVFLFGFSPIHFEAYTNQLEFNFSFYTKHSATNVFKYSTDDWIKCLEITKKKF